MSARFLHLLVILGAAVADILPRALVPDASLCLPSANLTELSGCTAMTEYEDGCKAQSTDDEKVKCYCQQEMLSDFYKCQSDVTLCIGSPILDGMFSSLTNEWHTECSARLTSLTFTPSSLAVSTLTATYDTAACSSLALSCTSADYETNLCSSTYLPARTTEYLSCVCKEPIYSLFSECQYNGNISCLATPAATSNILGYSVCPYFRPGASTLPSVDITSLIGATSTSDHASSLTVSNSGGASTILVTTKPPLPGVTSTSSGIPTSTKRSDARRLGVCKYAVVLVIFLRFGLGQLQL